MRILSNFVDYYDGVQKYGQDLHMLYLRKSETIYLPYEHNSRHYKSDLRYYMRHINCNFLTDIDTPVYLIGFCGKFYPCVKVGGKSGIKYCYDFQETIENIQLNHVEILKGKRRQNISYLLQDLQNFFYMSEVKSYSNFAQELAGYIFDGFKVPIFVYSVCAYNKVRLILNAKLSTYQFYKVFNSYLAFQELEMYLGGLASPEKPIPKIDDLTMARAKGFDKYSFRKDKKNS
jgi:hypothetical protein